MLTLHDIVGMSVDWPHGTVLVVTTALTFMLILFLLYQVALKAYDMLFLDTQSGTGTVIRKTFIPARLNLEEAARVAFQPLVLPDYWKLTIMVGERTTVIKVDKRIFDAVKEGGIVSVEFGIARRSGTLRLKRVIL